MAVDTDRNAAGLLVCLSTSSLNRSAATQRCVEELCGPTGRVDDPTRRALAAGYAGRMPRFTHFARLRPRTADPTVPPHGLETPVPPATDHPSEERTASWTDSRTSWLRRLLDTWSR